MAESSRVGRRVFGAALLISYAPNVPVLLDALMSAGLPRAVGGAVVAITLASSAALVVWPNDGLLAVGVPLLPAVIYHYAPAASNGGDAVAAVVGSWLVLEAFAIRITTSRGGRRWDQIAHFMSAGVRWQIYVIYAAACVGKLRTPQWRDGRAIASYASDPFYGVAPHLMGAVHWLGGNIVVGGLLSGFVLVTEGAIALSWLMPTALRKGAITGGFALHAAIGVLMGLGNFALVMVACLVFIWPSGTVGDRPTVPIPVGP